MSKIKSKLNNPLKLLLVLGATFIGSACHEGVVNPRTALNEKSGEIRTTTKFAALRLQFTGENGEQVDSVLAGPMGEEQLFVGFGENQAIIIHPQGGELSQVIKFRVFTAPGLSAKNIQASFMESALTSGELATPQGSIVWLP